MTQEADAKKVIQERRREIAEAQDGAIQGKPTPTQDELDLSAMGVPIEKHEEDGSEPETAPSQVLTRQAQPERTGQAQSRPQQQQPQQPQHGQPARTNPQS